MKNCTVDRGVLAICAMVLLLGLPDLASAQLCNQTLSVGANVASAAASAANNTTICLNNGNYGSVNFTNISRSGYVTVRSASGNGATIGANVSNSTFIKFQNLTISGGQMINCARNIQFLSSTFTDGLLFSSLSMGCSSAPFNILIDGNMFGDIPNAFWEGRLSIGGESGVNPIGITVSNNYFGPGCQADGIQVNGNTAGLVIGPGNIFENIIQAGPVHCDAIQFYSGGTGNIVTGNWFKTVSVALTHHTSAPNNTTFTHNVITNTAQVQIGSMSGFTFEHNTIYNLTDLFRFNAVGPSNGVSYRSNIIIGNTAAPPAGVVGTASHNLCGSASMCSGTNQIIGTPSFVGGAPGAISTLAGWGLTAASVGNNAGHDGQDVGVLNGPPPPLRPAPTNLTIINP